MCSARSAHRDLAFNLLHLIAPAGQTPIMHRPAPCSLVKPYGMAHTPRIDHQRWAVMWTTINLPVVKSGAQQRTWPTIRSEPKQRMITLIRLKNMTPHKYRCTICINGIGHPAALTGMVSQLELRLEGTATVR